MNDLMEEFGDIDDTQDVTAVIYTSEYIQLPL
jgi:hypothetical protein